MSLILDALRRGRAVTRRQTRVRKDGHVDAVLATLGYGASTPKWSRWWVRGLMVGVAGVLVGSAAFLAWRFGVPGAPATRGPTRPAAQVAANKAAPSASLPRPRGGDAAPTPGPSSAAKPAPRPSTSLGATLRLSKGREEAAAAPARPAPLVPSGERAELKPLETAPRSPAVAAPSRRAAAAAPSGRTPAAGTRSDPATRGGAPATRSGTPSGLPSLASKRPATPPPPTAVAAAPPPRVERASAPPATDAEHFKLALYYQRAGDFENALVHYRALLQANELNAEARNNLGLLYQDKGLLTEAIMQFQRAIIIDPKYAKAHNNLGVAYLRAERVDAAAAEFRAVLAGDPKNLDALINLALAAKAAGSPGEAQDVLMRALRIDPHSASAHYNLAMLYEEQEEFAKAVDHYQAFLKDAGVEHAAVIGAVRSRIDALSSRFNKPGW